MLFEREEKTALIILAAVIIVLFLAQFAISGYDKSEFAEIYSNESETGNLVILKGEINTIDRTKSGGHIILDVSGVKVFIPGGEEYNLSVQKNDIAEITGTVDLYNGEREIVVDKREDIRITKKKG
ncbi:OB-fold nucleic acid binding domain-containing protein [Methanoplanus endosymbiosus]|uniref:OB-fold nucleic acid binding domain-containing protein n=1 Tax=Methanoplanus endosymbiosus TaxID=33865 RepID=A0A9E7TJ10_9EURY|nr:OB-fold nucleic acid binding domain-containing protein [Methanoplanus endosymbiosus]UUX91275.1 OB-fold nucleic acid binding domain-containing protein [Methanoplanus endosymbiosus]